MSNHKRKPCPTCSHPVNGEPVCPVCKSNLLAPDHPAYYIPGYIGTTHPTPPVSLLDDSVPVPGPLSETYDKYISENGQGKRVRIKRTGETGIVFGVDPCPMPGSSTACHPEVIESGYLHIKLDKPTGPSDRVFAAPSDVEVL